MKSFSIKVISLLGDSSRQARFRTLAIFSRLQWSFFNAHQKLGPNLVYDHDHALLVKGRGLTAGELGCFSSHFALWNEFVESDKDFLAVIEDDVIIDWKYLELVLIRSLITESAVCIKLFSKSPCSHIVLGELYGRYILKYAGYSSGTQAYILNRAAAIKLIDCGKSISRPVDDYLDSSWLHGVPCLGVFPSPVIEGLVPSRVGQRLVLTHSTFIRHVQHALYKKYVEALIFINYIKSRFLASRYAGYLSEMD